MATTETTTTVASTILSQLGGRRFLAMTGAKNLIPHPGALSFRLPSYFASEGINAVQVTLNGRDTYDVTFSRIRGIKVTRVSSIEGVYADQLRGIFTAQTGLDVSL